MKKTAAILVFFVVLALCVSACVSNTDENSSAEYESGNEMLSDKETDKSEIISEDNLADNSGSDDADSNLPAMTAPQPEESSEIAREPEGSISVVVLGDSIARGYGLENVETMRFSALLAESLKTVYAEVSVANYGVDGQTGAELLEQLQKTPPEELQNCDCVIISIGGNNILHAVSSVSDAMNILSTVDPQVFVDYFKYLFSQDQDTKNKYEYACGVISRIFEGINNVFESEQFKSVIDKAEKKLSDEIPKIVSEIKRLNPDVDIYIQTVYNPYSSINVSFKGIDEGLNLASYGENAVAKLNAPIESLAIENGYTVVPVWERFNASKKTLTNAGFDIFNAHFSIDPHPNSNGHSMIADIYFEMLTEAQDE